MVEVQENPSASGGEGTIWATESTTMVHGVPVLMPADRASLRPLRPKNSEKPGNLREMSPFLLSPFSVFQKSKKSDITNPLSPTPFFFQVGQFFMD